MPETWDSTWLACLQVLGSLTHGNVTLLLLYKNGRLFFPFWLNDYGSLF